MLFSAIAIMIMFSISYAEENTAQIKKPAVKKLPAAETFTGRVIFLNNEAIEIKKGGTEITLNFKDGTIFVNMAGEEKNIDIIKLCQNVKAFYTKEGNKNILQKIIVIKESNCVK